jgi:hypothetical protein
MLSSFVVQLVLYIVVMTAGNVHVTADDIRDTGMHARTMLAVYQVLVVCVLISAHTVFLYFIRVVKRDKASFVLVERPLDLGESETGTPRHSQHRAHELSWQEKQREEKQWDDIQLQERVLQRQIVATESLTGAHWQDPEQDLPRGAEKYEDSRAASAKAASTKAAQAGSTQYAVETASVTVSEASVDVLPLSIVFESSTNLDLYVLYVNFVGLVLWDTFVSFNFATNDSNFVLVCGLVCGWICNTMSNECRCHISKTPTEAKQKLVFLFYASMFVLVMSLGAVQWRVSEDLDMGLQINLYLPAFFSGLFWTGVGVDVAFTGVVNENATKGILYDARRSLPTFLLVMCVSALYSSPETRQSVIAYTSGLSRLALLHLLLIEPVLIFLSMYVMVIALEKQRSTDFTVVMVLVQGVRVAYHSEVYDGVVITAIAASVLLVSVHVSRLVRG